MPSRFPAQQWQALPTIPDLTYPATHKTPGKPVDGAHVLSADTPWCGIMATLVIVISLSLTGCAEHATIPSGEPGCVAAEIPADRSSAVPRPEIRDASFSFHGNMPGQVDFVFAHPGGTYDYVERWEVGEPGHAIQDLKVGWDWKTGCRMHRCPMPDGSFCCHQDCGNGGHERLGFEPPDAFSCMNSAAGGKYDWFIAGLRDGGMSALDVCGVAPPKP
jgi:hypothetical protein